MASGGRVGRYWEPEENRRELEDLEVAEVANVLIREIIKEKIWEHKMVAITRDSRFGRAKVGIVPDDSFDETIVEMELRDDEEMGDEDEDYHTNGESSGGDSDTWKDEDEAMAEEK